MKTKIRIIVLEAAYILILLLMFVLPIFSVPDYSIIRNTVSELGAQFSPNAWLLNLTIIFLAIGCVIAGWSYFEGFALHRILLVLLGTSLILTAIFNHAPVNPDIQYNIKETGLNAYFSCTAVISFIILSIATSFVMERQNERLLALSAGLSAIMLVILASEMDQQAGIWQRLLYIISFGWMIYSFHAREY